MVVEIDNVELSFGDRRIINGVYMKSETGKVTGILGRNGSGKTSFLRIVFGSLNPKYKNIRIDGVHQKRNLYINHMAAYLPQHRLLPIGIKLLKAFRLFEVDWNEFIAIFERFSSYEKASTNEISSGELRVVETYLILNSNKPILLLDEPFSFIAPIYVSKIKSLIEIKKKESAIFVTDHFYRDILEVSDTVYLLKEGNSKLVLSKEDLKNEGYLKP